MIDLSGSADMSYKPTLYDVQVMLDQRVVGETQSRMAIFTNWVLGCQNVNVTGQRAAGKTHTVEAVGKFLPKRNGLYNISFGSEKSTFYQAEQMRSHSHIMIPELNKIPKQTVEILKTWGEGREATYDVTVGDAKNRYVEKKRLPAKPFIFCLADEEEMKLDEQLRSRLTVVRMDISEEQNIRVMKQKANLAMLPSNPKQRDQTEVESMQMHVGTLPPFRQEGYRHPAAEVFIECIPSTYTDCRRDFDKYLNNTFGITRFHWKDRLKYQRYNKDVYFVTPQDMFFNHVIYGETLVESSLRCSNMERQLIAILQNNCEHPSGQLNLDSMDVNFLPMRKIDLQRKVRHLGMNISAHMLNQHMRNLEDQGYVEVNKVGHANHTYTVGALFKDFKFVVDWTKVLDTAMKNMQTHYKKYAEEYITKYCMEPICMHPLTGEEVDLRKLGKTESTTKKVDDAVENMPVQEELVVTEETIR